MHPFEYSRLVFLGMVGSMMLYNSLKFFQLRDYTYFFYTGYMLCMIAYFSRNLFLNINESYFQYQLNVWLSVVAPMFSYIFYYRFSINFLELKKTIPFLFKFSNALIVLVIAFIIFYTYVKFDLQNQKLSNQLHDLMRVILILASVLGITTTFRQQNKIMNYFATGSFFLTLGGTVAFIMSMNYYETDNPSVFESPLLYFQLGIILEIMCFSLGLALKQRTIEMEKGRVEEALILQTKASEIDRTKAILAARELERNRISKELHDDLGSGLTEIRLLSEVIKSKSPNENLVEVEKISKSSSELIDSLSEIVWTMNPRNDSLDNLLVYLRTYALNYFENVLIDCKSTIPLNVPKINLNSEIRRNIFLVVKESLHNIVKHSKANKVTLEISFVNINVVKQIPDEKARHQPFYDYNNSQYLQISIDDNGKGISFETPNLMRNGLINMEERMTFIGGSFEMFNNNGTKTVIRYPLHLSPT